MDVSELLSRATDSVTVGRVFGEPVERDGVTVIPVARVRGGAGGGEGTDSGGGAPGSEGSDSQGPGSGGSGSGGGVGFTASPAGVFVISGNQVTWRPAVDVNRIVLGGQIVGLALVLTLHAALRRRAHR